MPTPKQQQQDKRHTEQLVRNLGKLLQAVQEFDRRSWNEIDTQDALAVENFKHKVSQMIDKYRGTI